MSYHVQFKDGDTWIAAMHKGQPDHVHMSSADVAARDLLKSGKTVRVLAISGANLSTSVIYEFSPETHRIDVNGQVRELKLRVGTIDLTPTWSAILPVLLLALTNGTDEGKRIASEELKRMAEIADAYNASVK